MNFCPNSMKKEKLSDLGPVRNYDRPNVCKTCAWPVSAYYNKGTCKFCAEVPRRWQCKTCDTSLVFCKCKHGEEVRRKRYQDYCNNLKAASGGRIKTLEALGNRKIEKGEWKACLTKAIRMVQRKMEDIIRLSRQEAMRGGSRGKFK